MTPLEIMTSQIVSLGFNMSDIRATAFLTEIYLIKRSKSKRKFHGKKRDQNQNKR